MCDLLKGRDRGGVLKRHAVVEGGEVSGGGLEQEVALDGEGALQSLEPARDSLKGATRTRESLE